MLDHILGMDESVVQIETLWQAKQAHEKFRIALERVLVDQPKHGYKEYGINKNDIWLYTLWLILMSSGSINQKQFKICALKIAALYLKCYP